MWKKSYKSIFWKRHPSTEQWIKNIKQVTEKRGGLKGHQIYEKKLNFTDYQISTNENKILFYEISSNYKDWQTKCWCVKRETLKKSWW